jgi:MFS family permease
MSPLFLQRELGHTPATAGAVFASAMLVGSLLQPLLGRYSDTRDRHMVFIAVSAIGIICAFGAAYFDAAPLIVASLGASMALLIAVRSGVLASAVDFAGTRAATTLGFVFVLLDGVGALGALLAGMVAESDLRYCFVLAAVLSMTSVVLAGVIRRRNRLQQPQLNTRFTG